MNDIDLLRGRFENALNRHGYGFQYAALKEALAANSHGSPWSRHIIEFPTQVQGRSTRVDFVLQHRSANVYLAAECKRANPALSNWCFARSELSGTNSLSGRMYLEVIDFTKKNGLRSYPEDLINQTTYDVAIEVRSGKKGEGTGRGAIEEAATQVCRGTNGLVDFFANRIQSSKEEKSIAFLPVIFTTANLWITDTDLASADLTSGNVSLRDESIKESNWVCFHYPQSPGIKHSVAFSDEKRYSGGLSYLVQGEFVRPIMIVNAKAIKEFLSWNSWGSMPRTLTR